MGGASASTIFVNFTDMDGHERCLQSYSLTFFVHHIIISVRSATPGTMESEAELRTLVRIQYS